MFAGTTPLGSTRWTASDEQQAMLPLASYPYGRLGARKPLGGGLSPPQGSRAPRGAPDPPPTRDPANGFRTMSSGSLELTVGGPVSRPGATMPSES